jgi:hypothetical protein
MAEPKQWYEEYQAELHADQDNKPREQIVEELKTKSEHVFDPDNAPVVTHHWVDRGTKLSCEGAGHPMHQAYKRK